MPTPSGKGVTSQQQEGLPSLASAVSSLSVLCKRWKEGTLSRNTLKDFVLGEEDPELFFKRRSDGDFTEDYGPICTTECLPPVSYFWLRRWYANFKKTFYEEEHFFKVDERDLAHHELQRAPSSK